jgi:acyl carrier protein
MTRKEIEKKLKEIIIEQFGHVEVKSSTRLVEDLTCDSLDTVELLMAVEDEFLLNITQDDEEEAERSVKTFEDGVNFVEKLVKQQHKEV